MATALCAALVLVLGLVFAGCGSGTGSLQFVEPPSSLVYGSGGPLVLETCVNVAPIAPTHGGVVDVFSISPALPSGLSFDPATGAVSGAPTAPAPPTVHTVTATGPGGSTQAQIELEVLAATPPSALSYGSTDAVYATGAAIEPNAPTFQGTASAFSVTPALPAGLTLDPFTGVIGGSPTTPATSATYTVTASNCLGQDTTTQIAIAVVDGSFPNITVPRFVFVANEDDDTVSRLLVHGATGQARHSGWLHVAGGPRHLAVAPSGTRLFVLAATTPAVHVFDLAADGSANAVPGSPFALPANSDPRSIALGPAAQRVYVSLGATDQIAVFAVQPNGSMTAVPGSPMTLTGTGSGPQGPTALALSPGGQRLFVTLTGPAQGAVVSLPVGGSGLPSNQGQSVQAVQNGPLDIVHVPGTGNASYVVTANAGAGTLTSLAVAPNGQLSFVGTLNVGGGSATPVAIAIGTFGASRVGHVALQGFNLVRRFDVNPANGALTLVGPQFYGAPAPSAIAFSRDGSTSFTLCLGSLEPLAGRFDGTGGWIPVSAGGDVVSTVRVRPGARSIAIAHGAASVQVDDTHLYVANFEDSDVSQFGFAAATNELDPLQPPFVAAGEGPISLAVHPRLARLYVADGLDSGGGDLRVFPIGTGGVLGAPTPIELGNLGGAAALVSSVVVDRSGRFLYAAASAGTGAVFGFSIHPTTGALTPIGQWPIGDTTRGAAIDPTGRFLYVVEASSNPPLPRLRGFRIDPASGLLDALDPFQLPSGSSPFSIAVHPSGRYLYVANNGSSSVTACSIHPVTGAPAPLAVPIVSTGGNPRDLVVEPLGRFLYVATQATNGIERLRITPDSGALTAVGSAAPAQGAVGGLAVGAGGLHLYAAVQGTGMLRVWTFDAAGDGQLTEVASSFSGAGARAVAPRRRLQ